MSFWLYHGDCIRVMRTWPSDSIDAVVTDPPYELTQFKRKNPPPYVEGSPFSRHRVGVNGDSLPGSARGFMGKTWDGTGVAFSPECWAEVLRVLKPGSHLLAFGGTRTYHRMGVAIEDAGFEIRDSLHWFYGTGFPKSLNAGEGRGTALKPGHEPIVLARKPLIGTVAANTQKWGVGALNIDNCRIETADNLNGGAYAKQGSERHDGAENWRYKREGGAGEFEQPVGRWPANVLLDESSASELDSTVGSVGARAPVTGDEPSAAVEDGGITNPRARVPGAFHDDEGGPSRFFYVAKPSRSERDAGCELLPLKTAGEVTGRVDGSDGLNSPRAGAGRTSGAQNGHPTVKPIALMRYLVRLITPPGGVVLDPFMGSGTTGIAALQEGLRFVGIEQSVEYLGIANARITYHQGAL